MTKHSDEANHNAKQILETVKSAYEREAAVEAKIATLRKERNEIRSEMKGAGIKLRDYDTIKRLVNLEPEDQAESKTSWQLCYEALRPGEQLNWLETAA